ncbi:MAG: extracellular solute-binding protein, partial [Phyllobacterium sp.]
MIDRSSNRGPFGRIVRAGVAAVLIGLHMAGAAQAQERVKIEWWNGLSGRLAEITDKLISDFNASQDKYEVVGVGKGNYEETMAAMVAAYRVGQQPVLVQAAERGFLTMHSSGAVIP